MPRYEVKLIGTRLLSIEATLEVVADNEEDAEQVALDSLDESYDGVQVEEVGGKGTDEWYEATSIDQLLQ